MSFSKGVLSYFVWEMYGEGNLIGEVVSVEKFWIDVSDEYFHGEEDYFGMWFCCCGLLLYMRKYIRRGVWY